MLDTTASAGTLHFSVLRHRSKSRRSAAIAKLNAAFRQVVALAEVEKHFANNGRALNVLEEMTRLIKEEEAMWANVAKVAGFKPM